MHTSALRALPARARSKGGVWLCPLETQWRDPKTLTGYDGTTSTGGGIKHTSSSSSARSPQAACTRAALSSRCSFHLRGQHQGQDISTTTLAPRHELRDISASSSAAGKRQCVREGGADLALPSSPFPFLETPLRDSAPTAHPYQVLKEGQTLHCPACTALRQ